MGITGQVGGATARTLIKEGKRVRGIVRDKAKASAWEAAGVELAVADAGDAAALEAAFRGAEGVFLMVPPNFAPAPGYAESRTIVAALRLALDATRPNKAVHLSSIGAQRKKGLGPHHSGPHFGTGTLLPVGSQRFHSSCLVYGKLPMGR